MGDGFLGESGRASLWKWHLSRNSDEKKERQPTWLLGSRVGVFLGKEQASMAVRLGVKVKVTQLCPALCNPMDCSPWNFPGQNTGVGNCSPLQGIFPTQGSNPGLLHCKQILYQLSHQESSKDNKDSLYLLYNFCKRLALGRSDISFMLILQNLPLQSWRQRAKIFSSQHLLTVQPGKQCIAD